MLAKLSSKVSIAVVLIAGLSAASSADARAAKAVKPAPVVDWTAKAEQELAMPTRASDKQMKKLGDAVSVPSMAATVHAEVEPLEPAIRRTALRMGLSIEAFRPSGTARFAGGETVDYTSLDAAPMLGLDLRWLPLEWRHVVIGGFVAASYARHAMPLTAPSGFRYDDVALNSLRAEIGAAFGLPLSELTESLNFEARVGVGRLSQIQTSRYSDVVGTQERPFILGAMDLSYHFTPRFGAIASLATRTPMGDGSGSVAFDRLTASVGATFQIR